MRTHLTTDCRLALETGLEAPLELEPSRAPFQHLKRVMRSTNISLEHPIRSRLWTQMALRHCHRADTQFDAQLEIQTNKLPLFVEPRVARFFALNSGGRKEVTSVLWHLSQTCPHVTYAPLAFPLTSLFLHFHSAEDTYRSLYSLMNAKDLRFMATSRSEKARDAIVLVKLTNKFGIVRPRRFGSDAREKLRNNALDAAFGEYLEWIICLPFHHLVRVIDCYLAEGEKFLFRVALCLALLHHKHASEHVLTLERMRAFCQSIGDLVTPQQLIISALKITRLSRKDIQKQKTKADQRSDRVLQTESPHHSAKDLISAKDYVLGTRIAPRRFRSAVVDNWTLLDLLWEWLPERVVVREPEVVFCSQENGNSLQTFFTLCADAEPTLLLVKSLKSEVFGAFCSSAWSHRLDSAQTNHYFGTGETFLFALHPKPVKYEWVGRRADHISHSQQLFQSASARSLCVGSGGGRFGLFIDESLTRGQSDRCETFANEALTSDSTHFDIAILEVIAFS